jgi:protein-S-isoprenylcysteine O-methyltransferase Ste14
MVAFHLVIPGNRIIPAPWNLLGLVPAVGGIIINVVADRAFRIAQTTVKPFKESKALITTGAYRISRHPMYLGFALVLFGVAALLRSLTPFFVIPVFVILMERVFISIEEKMLREQFGQDWLEYKSKVRRWI